MRAYRCKSSVPLQTLLDSLRASGLSSTLLDPALVYDEQHLLLAEELARKSRADGQAISERPEVELMLWLAAETNVQSAIARVGAKSPSEFVWAVMEPEAVEEGRPRAPAMPPEAAPGRKAAAGGPRKGDAGEAALRAEARKHGIEILGSDISSPGALALHGVEGDEMHPIVALAERMALSRIKTD